jgi:hypothetical protein
VLAALEWYRDRLVRDVRPMNDSDENIPARQQPRGGMADRLRAAGSVPGD